MSDVTLESPASSSFRSRVERVFRFETGVYREIAADERGRLQALAVVGVWPLICSSLPALGLFFILAMDYGDLLVLGVLSLSVVIFAVLSSVVTTATAAIVARIVAGPFTAESPGVGGWFRALAFAQAPLGLGVIPVIGFLVGLPYGLAASMACIHGMCGLRMWQSMLIWTLSVALPLVALTVVAVGVGVPIVLMVVSMDFP